MLDIRGMRIANQWFSSLLFSEPYDVTIDNFKAQWNSWMLWVPK